jgi:hypothetical protein
MEHWLLGVAVTLAASWTAAHTIGRRTLAVCAIDKGAHAVMNPHGVRFVPAGPAV